MLREWIKNIPLAQIEVILADKLNRRLFIWKLASEEYERRRREAA